MPQQHEPVSKTLLEAFGLDPDEVTNFLLVIVPGAPPRIRVHVEKAEVITIVDAIKNLEVKVPSAEPANPPV